MTEILFIAFEYPPINVAGSYRPYMFSKYLPSFNIKPIVVTVDTNSKHDYTIDQNSKHFEELPSAVEINTVPIESKKGSLFEKFNKIYLSIGDDRYKRWKKNAIKDIEKIIKTHHIKAIFFTAPPFSIGNLAVEVSKKYNLPLILDMRDAWSQWCIAPYASKIHYLLTKKREAYFFENAQVIIANTHTMKDLFIETHPKLNREKIQVIHNGFDITEEEIPKILSPNITSDEIKIGYIGTFYYNTGAEKSLNSSWWEKKPYRWFQYFPIVERWIYRTPFFFFKTLISYIKMNPTQKVKFVLIGKLDSWLASMIKEHQLEEYFEYRGFIDNDRLEEATKDINYFLVTSAKVENGKHYAIASKTFDYIKFKKPILAFVCEGAQKTFIEHSNTGIIFNPDNIIECTKKLNDTFKNETNIDVNIGYLKNFTRYHSTKRLSEIITNLI